MSPSAVSRRIRRVAGLVRLERKLFRTARFVDSDGAMRASEPAVQYGEREPKTIRTTETE